MKFKVSTKEKFTTITVNEANIYAKLTDNLSEICLPYLTLGSTQFHEFLSAAQF